MKSLSLRDPVLYAGLALVVEALGGISSESTVAITDYVNRYTSELAASLATSPGDYISTCRKRFASYDGESARWDERLRHAVDKFLCHPAHTMGKWSVQRRSRQFTFILRDLRVDIKNHLDQVAAQAESQGAAGLDPPHHGAPAAAVSSYASSSAGPPALVTHAARLDDALPFSLPSTSDPWPESCSYTLREDSQRRVAAGELLHMRVLGKAGCPHEHFPSVEMLCDVAPCLVSIKTDIPFVVGPSVVPHLGGSRLFPALESLSIVILNAGSWDESKVATTLAGFQADHVADVRLINVPISCVHLCNSLVRVARTCIIIHDWRTRDIVYTDRRGFRRSVRGDFVNAIPFVFDPVFFESITVLTLTELMPEEEVTLLFACFPRFLQHLQLYLDGFPWEFENQYHLLAWRRSGRGCCAHLRRLTLTGKSPLEVLEDPILGRFSVKYSSVYDFLDHIHDNTYYERFVNGNSVGIFAEGGVTLLV